MQELSTGGRVNDQAFVPATPVQVFEYADDHARLASHMRGSSWMMAGSRMDLDVDDGMGRTSGSHIRMKGKVLGYDIFLDEVVTRREPPRLKVWETVGTPRLLVIGSYRMGFEVSTASAGARLRVFIDYELPARTRWIGYLLGGAYARWCVQRMVRDTRDYFFQSSGRKSRPAERTDAA